MTGVYEADPSIKELFLMGEIDDVFRENSDIVGFAPTTVTKNRRLRAAQMTLAGWVMDEVLEEKFPDLQIKLRKPLLTCGEDRPAIITLDYTNETSIDKPAREVLADVIFPQEARIKAKREIFVPEVHIDRIRRSIESTEWNRALSQRYASDLALRNIVVPERVI